MNNDGKIRAGKQDHSDPISCPSCESTEVSTSSRVHRFVYGDGPSAVELSAVVPVRTCGSCGFQFLDGAAEDAQEEAVYRHLQLMTPRQIAGLLKLQNVSLERFASLTRIGVASLRRWLRGAKKQNPAYDDYLYLLGWPENLDRLRQRHEQFTPTVSERPVAFRSIDPKDYEEEAAAFRLYPQTV